MKKIIIMFLIFTIVCTFSGCFEPTYTENNLVGTWDEGDTGEVWTFYDDGELVITGRNYGFIFWIEEDFFWYELKEIPEVKAKFSLDFLNENEVELKNVGAIVDGEYRQSNPDTATIYHLNKR